MLALAKREQIGLTVVGPEAPLDRGMADQFRGAGLADCRSATSGRGTRMLEGVFEALHGASTAFRPRDSSCATRSRPALEAVAGDQFGFPVVVKADGLAAGKGVVVAADRAEAEAAVRGAMVDRLFGAAGATLVIEECLTGPEVSFFALCDGAAPISLGSAQDHKRIFDGDRGPNTGGMGAFAPSPLMTPHLEAPSCDTIVEPVIDGLQADGGYRRIPLRQPDADGRRTEGH